VSAVSAMSAVSAAVDQEPATLHDVSWLLISMLAGNDICHFSKDNH
jgi:hypothetical protein